MKFDLFHSIGRVDSVATPIPDRQCFQQFFAQVELAEDLGLSTVWVAESHFSSEVQKQHKEAVIPNYHGEVGLNCDSFQLAQQIFARTRRIGFGTAILNIVGGNGGPIAAADRVRTLAYFNAIANNPRHLHIGVAAGRFPYINAPFGIVPRSHEERVLWSQYKQLIFVEALEIFLRLSKDEVLSSDDLTRHRLTPDLFRTTEELDRTNENLQAAGLPIVDVEGLPYVPRWSFEPLKLVPALPFEEAKKFMTFVLGSSDPLARDLGLKHADLDVFNLSFTPPHQLNAIHAEMREACAAHGRLWHRSRLPRTVLVFVDKDLRRAERHAAHCFETYIEAMRGTVKLPPKEVLMERALIGDPEQIREQLSPGHPKGFDADDRLMLWFEFNQTDGGQIAKQMRIFAEGVMPHVS